MNKIFEHYPFKNIGVTILEGLSSQGGIDYVLNKNGEFASFEVYSMYEGDVHFGVSLEWGRYLIVSKVVGKYRYDTVYAHLDHMDADLQKYAMIQGDRDFIVPSGYFLGWSSTHGNSKSNRKLHIELYETDMRNREKKILDPYGLDGVLSSQYPVPGKSLKDLNHYWISDNPNFIV